jgi:SPX domain protein involved in polyphosphate accumulation
LKYGDFSRLPAPLSWKDLIYLEVYSAEFDKIKRKDNLVFEDIRFYLHHSGMLNISAVEMKHLPSYVAALEAEMERRIK